MHFTFVTYNGRHDYERNFRVPVQSHPAPGGSRFYLSYRTVCEENRLSFFIFHYIGIYYIISDKLVFELRNVTLKTHSQNLVCTSNHEADVGVAEIKRL